METLKRWIWYLTTPTVCAWCKRTMRPAPLAFLLRSPHATHGICQPCLETLKATIPAEK